MSTLILGITLDNLAAALILLPLCGALLNIFIATMRGDTSATWMQPMVKILGVGVPFVSLVLLIMMYLMSSNSSSAMVLGPYAMWFGVQGVMFDIALWFDPLCILWSALILGLGVLTALYCFFDNDTGEDLALVMAKQHLFLFFLLLLIWVDSIPILYFAWEGIALAAYWLWLEGDKIIKGRAALFWLTRAANSIFLLGLLWAVVRLSGVGNAESGLRLTFALLEEHRQYVSAALLFTWLIPALVYAAQWPFSFWLMNSRDAAPSRLISFYSFGLAGAGLYLLTRLNVLILSQQAAWYWLELVGALTALFAAITALRQRSLRGVLVALMISHFGIILCAFGTGNFLLALIHWLCVALAGGLLASGAGLIHRYTGTDTIAELSGLAKEMPWVAFSTLVACLALIGLPPLATFVTQSQLLWSFVSEARYGALAAIGLSSLLLPVATMRWWAATFLGPRLSRQRAAQVKATWLIVLTVAIMLLGISWTALPKTYHGPEALQTWLLPVFEDYLPIRSERFSLEAQWYFAFVCWLCWFSLILGVAFLFARQRRWLSRQRDYWVWWDAVDRFGRRMSDSLQSHIKKSADFLVRTVLHDGLEHKLLDGLALRGVGASFKLAGRICARVQSGRVGHYLIFLLLGVMLLAAIFTG